MMMMMMMIIIIIKVNTKETEKLSKYKSWRLQSAGCRK
jgi:hypothetical protein